MPVPILFVCWLQSVLLVIQSRLPALQSKKSDLISDKDKFKKLIQQLEANQTQLEAKLDEKSREIQLKGCWLGDAQDSIFNLIAHLFCEYRHILIDTELSEQQRELHKIISKIDEQVSFLSCSIFEIMSSVM